MKKLTVTEYQKQQESLGNKVSKKTLYKRIDKGMLQTTTEKVNNRDIKFILVPEAGEEELTTFTPSSPNLEDLHPPSSPSSPMNSPSLEVINPPSSPSFYSSILETLEKQLEEKDRQMKEKDRQLEEKDKQIEREQAQNKEKDLIIKEQLEKMNELLRNSQLLQAQVNNLLTTGAGNEPLKGNSIIDSAAQEKKKSWFSRWMFGD